MFDHVQRQSVAFFTQAQTGALVSRLNTDVIGAQQAFTSTLSGVVGNLITVVVVLVTMFWLSWQITVLALILVPIFLFPARYMGRGFRGTNQAPDAVERRPEHPDDRAIQRRRRAAGAELVGRPAEEQQAYEHKAAGVRDMGVKIALANRYFFTALTLVAALSTAIAYGLGGNLVIDGTLSSGDAFACHRRPLGAVVRAVDSVVQMSTSMWMTALVSFDRVFEVLDLQPMVADEPEMPPCCRADQRPRSGSITWGSGSPTPTRSRWLRWSQWPVETTVPSTSSPS